MAVRQAERGAQTRVPQERVAFQQVLVERSAPRRRHSVSSLARVASEVLAPIGKSAPQLQPLTSGPGSAAHIRPMGPGSHPEC